MSGLEKIVSEILSEAKGEANALLEEARAQAQQILAQYEADSAQAVAQIEQDASDKVSEIEAATQSEIQHQHRQGMLEVKQSLLTQALDHALEELYALEPKDYFALLAKIAASNAEQGKGVLLLGEKDLARAPEDFAKQLAQALPEGAHLSLSGESADIRGGCILRYGDVDRNCSFQAIFDARRDDFRDKVCEILFA